MRELAAAAALILVGCYSPDTRDCTVTCGSAGECAQGQVCGADGLCAAPSVAGHCSAEAADAAGPSVMLTVTIMGPGKITIDTVGVCDSATAPPNGCVFQVPEHVARQLAATATADNHNFMGWSGGCIGVSPMCTVTPVVPMTVGAKFQ